jgi:hypothetical protein
MISYTTAVTSGSSIRDDKQSNEYVKAMTAYNPLKTAHLEHRLQTVQASKHTVDATLKLVVDDSVHECSI